MSSTELELRATASNSLPPDEVLSTRLEADTSPHITDDTPANVVSVAPDGGFEAWLVVLGCASLTFCLNGYSGSWGVIQAALTGDGLASTSTLSFVGSLALMCCVGFGLVSIRIMRLLGARWTGIIGTTFLGVGQICASFTTNNVGLLFFTAGVLTGLGTSLTFMVASIVPAQYFSSKMGLANGLVKLGGGVGSTVLALAVNAAITKVGIAWCFRIVGLMTLSIGLPAAWVAKERFPINVPFIQWSLFKNFTFTAVFLAAATGVFALFVPPFYLPLFAQALGYSSSIGAALASAFNGCTAIGRFGAGPLCDRIGAVNTLFLAMVLNGLSMLAIWPVSNTLGPLIFFAILNGLANGAFFTSLPTVVQTTFGPETGASAFAMNITGWSMGYLMGTPIAGYLLQAGGAIQKGSITSFRPAIFYAGGIAFVSSAFVLSARFRLDRKVLKKL